eukprot:4184471-Amphidinium_carterae.1
MSVCENLSVKKVRKNATFLFKSIVVYNQKITLAFRRAKNKSKHDAYRTGLLGVPAQKYGAVLRVRVEPHFRAEKCTYTQSSRTQKRQHQTTLDAKCLKSQAKCLVSAAAYNSALTAVKSSVQASTCRVCTPARKAAKGSKR